MRQNGSFVIAIFILILGIGAVLAFAANGAVGNFAAAGVGGVAFVVAMLASRAQMAIRNWR